MQILHFNKLAFRFFLQLLSTLVCCSLLTAITAVEALDITKQDSWWADIGVIVMVVISLFSAIFAAIHSVLVVRWIKFYPLAKLDAKAMDIKSIRYYHPEVMGPVRRIWM